MGRQGDGQVPEVALRPPGGPAVGVVSALFRVCEVALGLVRAEGVVSFLDAHADRRGGLRVDVVPLLVVSVPLQQGLEGVLAHHRLGLGRGLGLLADTLVLDLDEVCFAPSCFRGTVYPPCTRFRVLHQPWPHLPFNSSLSRC